jgi:hypothetical protein
MLLIAALLIVVIFIFVRRVEDVPVTDVPADVFDVSVIDDAVEDITMVVAEDVTVAGIEDVTEVSEIELETLYQVLSPPMSSKAERKPSRAEVRTKRRTIASVPSWSWEEETEAELLARKLDEQLYGRRASKRKSNHEDLRPVGRRPHDNKEKGDFRVDRRLKASRQKAVVESRTA